MKTKPLSAKPCPPPHRTLRRRSHPWGLVSLLLLVFCPTCKQGASDTPAPASATSAPSSATVAPEVESAVAAQPGPGCAGKYQGEYTVSGIKPELTKKEGAPAQWETDDGKTLAGKGTLTLEVDSSRTISGTAQGALGQQTLRGACDENTLRVQLDSAADDASKIRNAYLVADVSGSDATGTLTAATGDSLVRRAGPVTLHRVP